MTHLSGAEEAATAGNDVVGRPTGLLVDHDEAAGIVDALPPRAPGSSRRPGSSGPVVPGTAQRLLHAHPGGDRRVGDEPQCRRTLQPHLACDGGLELGAPRSSAGRAPSGKEAM